MTFEISIPSKTFLVGEYGVMIGGPAIIAATSPRFLLCGKLGQGLAGGIHRESPTGFFIRENRSFFASYDVEFFDPHEGRGGLGASGAQFLAAWMFKYCLSNSIMKLNDPSAVVHEVWSQFRQILVAKEDRSSGADIVAQYVGHMTKLNLNPFEVSQEVWPFTDHGFAIFKTGVKVATHTHLADIQNIDSELVRLAQNVCAAYASADWPGWVNGLKAATMAQQTAGLVADSTMQILAKVKAIAGVEFARGSGSLAADTFVVYFENKMKASLLQAVRDLGYAQIATNEDVASGIEICFWPCNEKAPC